MRKRKLSFFFLVMLLVAGFAVLTASRPGSGSAKNLAAADAMGSPGVLSGELGLPRGQPLWEQVNSSGFGDLDAGEVSALETFSGYLYAGTTNPIDLALILRSPDGVTWTPVIQPGFGWTHDSAPPAILDMIVFNGRLYAGTGKGDGAGTIWRTVGGVAWAPMVSAGFGYPDTVDITAFGEFNSYIYAGATNLLSGAQIWRSFSGDSNTWTKVAPALPGMYGNTITGFAAFGGALYAAVESVGPAQIWRSLQGSDWTAVVSNGFGDSLTTSTGGMAVFGGYLYAGAGNDSEGAQLWRTDDGSSWQQMIPPGFGHPDNQKVETVFVFQNQLYASVNDANTGMELWRSSDGAVWEQVNPDGFGDSHNTGSNWSNATADFLSQLYVGTANVVAGGELWRMEQPAPQLQLPVYLPGMWR
jgi:hypothetical protein